LFSGIGGLDVGIELALGGETIWQVEQNEYCRQVLAKHWPNVRRYEDVKEVGAHNLEPVDCLIGGFPCQGASSAGKRKGLKDERSGLWFEYARIIRELEPRWVVIENVTGLTHRGLDQVLWSLGSLGYSAAWDCLSAASVGAPHIRDRLFIVAWKEMADAHLEGLEERHSERRDVQQEQSSSVRACDAVADPECVGREEGSEVVRQGEPVAAMQGGDGSWVPYIRRHEDQGQWFTEPDVGRVADGVHNRVAMLTCLGNAVVPQQAFVIGKWLLEIQSALRG
jgi:DNA (cytosine-5)-methyltransferase 1